MIESDESAAEVPALDARDLFKEDLPFRIVLLEPSDRAVERVLGRAASAALARAIYIAAQNEHVGCCVALLRGDQLIARSR